MSVIVTGASGYVGKNLLKKLTERNVNVYSLSRSSIDMVLTDKEDRVIFRTDKIQHLTEFLSSRVETPKTMIHLAALTDKSDSLDACRSLNNANILYTLELAALTRDIGIPRFVFTSTYSSSTNGFDYSPQTLYAATKFAAECLLEYFALSHYFQVVVLQLYDIYGPAHHPSKLIPQLLKSLKQGSVFRMTNGLQEICPLFIEDACEAIYQSTLCSLPDIPAKYAVLGPEILKVKDIPELISKASGLDWAPGQLLSNLDSRKNEIMLVKPRYPKFPNWEPVTYFNDGIRFVIERDM